MFQICHINVEVKKRELISRLDLAIEIVNRGIPVVIGECYDLKLLQRLGANNSYILGKCAQPNTIAKFKPLLNLGWSFGALDEEGLLPDSLESFATRRFSLESANLCKNYFFFGKAQKQTFENFFGSRKSFIVSGNPRSDMWQANCYGLYDQDVESIKKNTANIYYYL